MIQNESYDQGEPVEYLPNDDEQNQPIYHGGKKEPIQNKMHDNFKDKKYFPNRPKIISKNYVNTSNVQQNVKPEPRKFQPQPIYSKPKKDFPEIRQEIMQHKQADYSNIHEKTLQKEIDHKSLLVQLEQANKTISELNECLRIETLNSEEQRSYINVLKEILENRLDGTGLVEMLQSLKPSHGMSIHDVIIEMQQTRSEMDAKEKELTDVKQKLLESDQNIEALQTDNLFLNNQITELKTLNAKADVELQNSVKNLEQANILQEENAKLKNECSNLMEEVKKFKTKLVDEDKNRIELTEKIKVIEQFKESAEGKNEKLLQKLNEIEQSHSTVNKKFQNTLKNLENIEKEKEFLLQKNLSLDKAIQQQKEDFMELKDVETKQASELFTRTKDLKDIQIKHKELVGELKLKAEESHKLSKKNKELDEIIFSLETNYESLKNSHEILLEKSGKLSQQVSELDNLKRTAEAYQREILNLKQELQTINRLYDEIQQTNKKDLDNYTKAITSVNLEFQKVNDELIQMGKEKQQNVREILMLKNTIKELEQSINHAQKQNSSLKEDNMTLCNDIKTIKELYHREQSASAESSSKLYKIQQQKDEIFKEMQKQQEEQSKLHAQLNNSLDEIDSNRLIIDRLSKREKQLFDLNENYESSLLSVQESFKYLIDRINELACGNSAKCILSYNTKRRGSDVGSALTDTISFFDHIRTELDKSLKQNFELRNEAVKNKTHMQELESKLSETLHEDQSLRHTLEKLQDQLNKMMREKDKLERMVQQQTKRDDELERNNLNSIEQLKKLQKENHDLLARLRNAEESITEISKSYANRSKVGESALKENLFFTQTQLQKAESLKVAFEYIYYKARKLIKSETDLQILEELFKIKHSISNIELNKLELEIQINKLEGENLYENRNELSDLRSQAENFKNKIRHLQSTLGGIEETLGKDTSLIFSSDKHSFHNSGLKMPELSTTSSKYDRVNYKNNLAPTVEDSALKHKKMNFDNTLDNLGLQAEATNLKTKQIENHGFVYRGSLPKFELSNKYSEPQETINLKNHMNSDQNHQNNFRRNNDLSNFKLKEQPCHYKRFQINKDDLKKTSPVRRSRSPKTRDANSPPISASKSLHVRESRSPVLQHSRSPQLRKSRSPRDRLEVNQLISKYSNSQISSPSTVGKDFFFNRFYLCVWLKKKPTADLKREGRKDKKHESQYFILKDTLNQKSSTPALSSYFKNELQHSQHLDDQSKEEFLKSETKKSDIDFPLKDSAKDLYNLEETK